MQYKQELERLNEYQKAAVYDDSKACVVNANVGSGKTTVLIAKIMYLHYVKQIALEDMIVLTFTNKAANEIKERLTAMDSAVKDLRLDNFGTFHSVALHMLKTKLPVESLGYTKEFVVIEPEDELDLAQQIIQEEKLNIKYRNRLKKRLEQAMAVTDEKKKISSYNDDIFVLVDHIKAAKIRENKMSFNDLLSNVNLLLTDEVSYPRWIIIDEVQDSDLAQLEFIDHLLGEKTQLFAVGDPNQVIYSWRGSTINVFERLLHRYRAKEYTLPLNYRSSSSILEAAKVFLQQGHALKGVREPGSKIILKKHYNSFQEADYLADKIKRLHEEGIPYQEIAIFYRLQTQSKVIEDVMLRNQIPYEVSLKKTIRDIPVLNWIIHLLRYVVNPADLTSAVLVLSNKEYGDRMSEGLARKKIKEYNVQKIKEEPDYQETLFDSLFQLEACSNPVSPLNINTPDLFTRMNEFTKLCQNPASSKEIYDYLRLDSNLHPTSSCYQEDKEAVLTLFDIILKFSGEQKLPFIEGMTEFVNSSALYGVNILQKDIHSDVDSVKLMTLHASKGLEFSHVFITGVNNGLIPLNTREYEEEEEERRLFFVGLTRAKDNLELSYYTNPDTYRTMPGESRYLFMIPAKLLLREENQEGKEVNLQDLKKQIVSARETQKQQMVIANDAPKQQMVSEREKQKQTDELDNSQSTIVEQQNSSEYQDTQGSSRSHEEQANISSSEVPAKKRVRHNKYGEGTVVKEDDMMITVEFDSYGEKEFMKAFSELEEIG